MNKFLFCLLLFVAPLLNAQEPLAEQRMTAEKLQELITALGNEVVVSSNIIEFEYDGATLICVYDVNANRMRIISPITKLSEVNSEQLFLAMAANFHTVLDARYAIADGLVYAAFLHSLEELTSDEVRAAISQVAQAAKTFGSTYSSGEMLFPGREPGSESDESRADGLSV